MEESENLNNRRVLLILLVILLLSLSIAYATLSAQLNVSMGVSVPATSLNVEFTELSTTPSENAKVLAEGTIDKTAINGLSVELTYPGTYTITTTTIVNNSIIPVKLVSFTTSQFTCEVVKVDSTVPDYDETKLLQLKDGVCNKMKITLEKDGTTLNNLADFNYMIEKLSTNTLDIKVEYSSSSSLIVPTGYAVSVSNMNAVLIFEQVV